MDMFGVPAIVESETNFHGFITNSPVFNPHSISQMVKKTMKQIREQTMENNHGEHLLQSKEKRAVNQTNAISLT